jgi:hypothetical protein
MPHKADFSVITNIKEMRINPEGWIDPITVEYGLGMKYNIPSYFWRVKGTEHTFTIPISRFEFLSSGNYGEHFEMVLKKFREDYLEWKNSGFEVEWQREYRDQYNRYILI